MKQSLGVIFSLLLPLLAISQSFFTVNVGTFVDAKSPQFDDIRPFGFVYSYDMDGGLSQVYVGGFDNKEKASKIAEEVRNKGYRSAYVEERALGMGTTVTVIQLATRETDKLIEWQEFENVGNLFGILSDNQIKIVTGIYANVDAAKVALNSFRAGGFKDAFIKNVNNTLLIHINQFETGLKKPLIPIEINPSASTTAPTADNSAGGRVQEYGETPADTRIQTKQPDPVITARDPGPMTSNIPRTKAGSTPIPTIRTKIKRRSVLDLQTVLKAEKAYSSSLDGYYGPGTENGYNLFKQTDRTYQKYLILSEHFGTASTTGVDSRLQQAVNNLLDDPTAPSIIKNSAQPIAKAYQAYILFRTVGPGSDVNALMNEAIQGAYRDQKMTSRPPFDYNATYAYQDLDQLILHLHYLHAAPGNEIAAPCWLYEEHPKETAAAHASFARYSSETFKLQSCDQFLNWEEVQVLESVAADLNADSKPDNNKIASYASARAQLFLAPRTLDAQERKFVDQWNEQLWASINSWAARDPLNQKISTTLKVAFFQSQVRLEDYFMDKGFSLEDAKGLALATLKTIVGYPLERFSS